MRIFISHATKNKEIVLKFAELLEMVSSDIEVFCSSERGSINVGKNFIEYIFTELNQCDLFIPIISQEYYESKFCMMELGVAYSYLYNKYKKRGEDYIFPFSLYPVRKGQALLGTPIADIQVGDINDEADIREFLDYLSYDKGISIGSRVNRRLHVYKHEIDQILLNRQDIIYMAKINTYFDNSIEYIRKEDVVCCSITKEEIKVNYNMNPCEKKKVQYPNFISAVLVYVDKLDIGHYLDYNDTVKFKFVLTNYNNSLKRIVVEFKYSDSNRILETFCFELGDGKNDLCIPLSTMRSKALENISEICFVIHPDGIVEDKGMFKISELSIS